MTTCLQCGQRPATIGGFCARCDLNSVCLDTDDADQRIEGLEARVEELRGLLRESYSALQHLMVRHSEYNEWLELDCRLRAALENT